jgi:3-hydroxybutyryl-CoA dehydrogenase
MPYTILSTGPSAAFAADHPLLTGGAAQGEVVVVLGPGAGAAAMALAPASDRVAVLVELGTECLGEYTGESRGQEGSCVVGFSRFRLGDLPPSNLVELVRQPATPDAAIEAARSVLESAGLEVAVCGDFVGRIVDRLVRPYYNAALRRLDEGLATADDLDTTLRLGLGYPQGPIKLLEDSGLAAHWQVSQALFEQTGDTGYAPARRATVAHRRQAGTTKDGRA